MTADELARTAGVPASIDRRTGRATAYSIPPRGSRGARSSPTTTWRSPGPPTAWSATASNPPSPRHPTRGQPGGRSASGQLAGPLLRHGSPASRRQAAEILADVAQARPRPPGGHGAATCASSWRLTCSHPGARGALDGPRARPARPAAPSLPIPPIALRHSRRPPPEIDAAAWVLYSVDSEAETRGRWTPTPRRRLASVTKVMTAILVVENSLDRRLVTISAPAGRHPDRLHRPARGASRGDVDRRGAARLPLVQSGNDAAVALAEHVSGLAGASWT